MNSLYLYLFLPFLFFSLFLYFYLLIVLSFSLISLFSLSLSLFLICSYESQKVRDQGAMRSQQGKNPLYSPKQNNIFKDKKIKLKLGIFVAKSVGQVSAPPIFHWVIFFTQYLLI